MKSYHPQHEDLDDDMPCGYIDTENPWVRFFAFAMTMAALSVLIAGVTLVWWIIHYIFTLV